jgi:EPS-associated MarR family transcriptional regulator
LPMVKPVPDDVRFRVLRVLQGQPDLSQREIAVKLGVSLGAVNYCLRALTEKGQVKVCNFRSSDNKLRYAYILTPGGIAEKVRLTGAFLARKIAEYEALRAEIEALRGDSRGAGAPEASVGRENQR